MSAIFTPFLRRAVSAAFILALLTAGSSRADWSKLKGNYSGVWKSADTDGKHYSGTAKVSIKSGPGDSLTLTITTSFLGNPITVKGKAPASGKLKTSVNNIVLGTVTGTLTAKASKLHGSLKGKAPLYDGTATLNAKLNGSAKTLKATGTLVRKFPMLPAMTLTFSFSGKK